MRAESTLIKTVWIQSSNKELDLAIRLPNQLKVQSIAAWTKRKAMCLVMMSPWLTCAATLILTGIKGI